MSLSGLIVRRGSIVTVYHGLDTRASDASSVRTYPTNTPDVRMLLEDISDELVRRVFGRRRRPRCARSSPIARRAEEGRHRRRHRRARTPASVRSTGQLCNLAGAPRTASSRSWPRRS
jgi:hypothetical protein